MTSDAGVGAGWSWAGGVVQPGGVGEPAEAGSGGSLMDLASRHLVTWLSPEAVE
jgi:hypothetical protein